MVVLSKDTVSVLGSFIANVEVLCMLCEEEELLLTVIIGKTEVLRAHDERIMTSYAKINNERQIKDKISTV